MYDEGAVTMRTRIGAHPCAGSSPLRLDPLVERELRTRLRRWWRGRLRVPDREFDDAYQAAWRKLLETERRGRPTRNLEHALRWNLRNAWLEECRRRRRRPAIALEDATEAALAASATAAPDPGEFVERLEAARYLFEAIGTLTERQRRILLLRDVCGLKPGEVCRLLAISGSTERHEHAAAVRQACARVGELIDGRWCAQHRDLLVAYAARRATTAQIHAAQRHLRNCAGCRRRVAAVRLAAKTAPREAVIAAA